MNRKSFIRNSSMAALGLAASPAIPVAAPGPQRSRLT
jgi:hypothetical protein